MYKIIGFIIAVLTISSLCYIITFDLQISIIIGVLGALYYATRGDE